ncbi:MAG: GntR family transcriptional regulator, partial [Gammaproteobacteria bacterium]|nr:GntR family transcriptional regulator [Gammaproteobacteria bacterium]
MGAFLYEQIAGDISRAIQHAIYDKGDRLPSLRHICGQYNVSMATAIQAYQFLETQGLIESRPKSGYFVGALGKVELEEPATSRPRNSPTPVNVGQLAMSLVNEARQPGLVRLGAAVPEPAMLPVGNLSRTMAAVARRNPKALASYEQAQGNVLLRKQIARLMRESGVRCSPEEIIITNGCLEAMSLALRAVAKRGATIAI